MCFRLHVERKRITNVNKLIIDLKYQHANFYFTFHTILMNFCRCEQNFTLDHFDSGVIIKFSIFLYNILNRKNLDDQLQN